MHRLSNQTPPIPSPSRWECRALLIVLLTWVAIVLIGIQRYAAPPVIPANAAAGDFSAERAGVILKQLVGDGIAHPSGSEQNQVVRQRIVQLFEQFGYATTLQNTQQHPYGDFERPAVDLVNILAKLEGTSSKPAVMLAAHYDSRPEGPGASDDGAGTAAVLEIARMMKAESPPERSVIFLITDGEELGLLGAKGFVDDHPWAADVAAAINLEARGTEGPSLMFETGSDSLWLIQLFARAATHPLTSSLFFEIYRQLPNDTDFTLFKSGGMQGYNFAFIGKVRNYHTPEDNLENTSLESLQHHGENALGLIRELMRQDIENRPRGRAVYFDLFAYHVIWWPESYSVYLAGFALLLLTLCGCKLLAVTKRSVLGQSLRGVVFLVASAVCLAVVGAAINAGLTMDSVIDDPFPENPTPVAMSFWTAALALVAGLAWWNPSKTSWQGCWVCTTMLLGLLAILTSIYASGASYLFLVPALLVAAIACPLCFANANRQRMRVLSLSTCLLAVSLPLAIGLLWLPLERLFYDAVGFRMNLLMVARVTVVMTSLLPVLLVTGRTALLAILTCAGLWGVGSVILATVLN